MVRVLKSKSCLKLSENWQAVCNIPQHMYVNSNVFKCDIFWCETDFQPNCRIIFSYMRKLTVPWYFWLWSDLAVNLLGLVSFKWNWSHLERLYGKILVSNTVFVSVCLWVVIMWESSQYPPQGVVFFGLRKTSSQVMTSVCRCVFISSVWHQLQASSKRGVLRCF